MTPAAWGAVDPTLTVQARLSCTPVVKYVNKPSCLYVARISDFSPPSYYSQVIQVLCRLGGLELVQLSLDLRGDHHDVRTLLFRLLFQRLARLPLLP